MSVIYIIDHNELIYDAIESRRIIRKPPPLFPNRLDLKFVDPAIKKLVKKEYGTMGPAEYVPPDPSNYLRKNNVRKVKVNKFERHCEKHQKFAPLQQKGIPLIHNSRDFVTENVKVAKQLKPRVPDKLIVVTRNGDKINGPKLEPRFIYLKSFGKTPNYLTRQVNILGSMMQTVKDAKELEELTKCRYLTRHERDELLNGLKKNWEEKQKEYQLLPMITDTIPKQIKKGQSEKGLIEIEKDILLVEKHPFIYIIED